MIHARASPNRICVQEHFRIRSACPNVAPSAPQLRQKFRPPIQPYVRGNPQPPVKPRRLPLFQRLPRCPQHGMSEPDGAFCPNAARIRPAKRQKVRKALQEPPVYRRIVPVVDADDTAQLLGLSIGRACRSHDKIRRRATNASVIECLCHRARASKRYTTRSFESHASSTSGWTLIVLAPVIHGNSATPFETVSASSIRKAVHLQSKRHNICA
jgi:hypothetical protein